MKQSKPEYTTTAVGDSETETHDLTKPSKIAQEATEQKDVDGVVQTIQMPPEAILCGLEAFPEEGVCHES